VRPSTFSECRHDAGDSKNSGDERRRDTFAFLLLPFCFFRATAAFPVVRRHKGQCGRTLALLYGRFWRGTKWDEMERFRRFRAFFALQNLAPKAAAAARSSGDHGRFARRARPCALGGPSTPQCVCQATSRLPPSAPKRGRGQKPGVPQAWNRFQDCRRQTRVFRRKTGGTAEQTWAPELRALNGSAISMRCFRKVVAHESGLERETLR
jgi:hypothetical protein